MENDLARRGLVLRLFKGFSLLLGAGILFVLFDFAIDLRPPGVHSSYRFTLAELPLDQPVILRQDNLSILLIRRSAATIEALRNTRAGLQDPDSADSRQPDYARNPLRAREPEYFVSYALGTDLGCGVRPGFGQLQEVCGKASYDFAGRALEGHARFPNLTIPDYTFSDQHKILTIRP